jgi:hypothetical protein
MSACERPRMEDKLSLDAMRSEIRIAQSVSVVRQMPTIIAGNAIGAAISYYAIRSNQPHFAPEPILICIIALLIPMAWSWVKLRTRPRPKSVSQRRVNGIIIYSGALGLTWGALEAVYLSTAPFPVLAFATTAAGFLGAGSVAGGATSLPGLLRTDVGERYCGCLPFDGS